MPASIRVPSSAAGVTTALIAFAAALLPSSVDAQQRRSQPGWPCNGTVDPVYVQMAEATGGVVTLLKPAELLGVSAERKASDAHEEVVFRAGGQLGEGVYEFDIPLDSTIESAYFLISMQCLKTATVVQPSGQEVRIEADGVEYHRFEAIRLFTIPAPVPGPWTIRVSGRGYLSVLVKGKTNLRLADVTFGDGTFPIKRERQQLRVSMSGDANQIGFQLLSSIGATLERLTLTLEEEREGGRTYAGDVTPPNADARVAVTGTDAGGFRFQRVWHKLVVTER